MWDYVFRVDFRIELLSGVLGVWTRAPIRITGAILLVVLF